MISIKKDNAALFLFFNAFLWGSSYVWSKMLLGYMPRFSILLMCSAGGLLSTVLMFFPHIRNISMKTVKKSVLISFFSIISNTFFIFALQYTSSSNTAFIVQMSVVFTPMLTALVERKRPEGRVVASVLIAITGLFLLTCDITNLSFRTGDLLALGNALFFSIFLTSQKRNSESLNPVHFTIIHHAMNSVFFLGIVILFEASSLNFGQFSNPFFLLLISASVFITVFTILVQSSAIKHVRAEKATLIYTFEPAAALLMAAIFMGESLKGLNAVTGCILILFSVVYSIYCPRLVGKRSSKLSLKTMIREV